MVTDAPSALVDLAHHDDRDAAILSELARGGTVTFQGIRRRLGIHQQALARALRRLAREGLIVRGLDGYRLTGPTPPPAQSEGREVLHIALSSPDVAMRVTERLAGRWFRALHWQRRAGNAPGATLVWLDETGAEVALRTEGASITVEVADDAPGPAWPGAPDLLRALAEALREESHEPAPPPLTAFGAAREEAAA